MATLKLLKNPLKPLSYEEYDFDGRLIDWLQAIAPSGFQSPIRVLINGEDLPLSELDTCVGADDQVIICVQPGWAEVGRMVLMMIISYAVGRVLAEGVASTPDYAETYEDNPVYSLKPNNQSRLGKSIPVGYGSFTSVPDYASSPYSMFTEVHSSDNNPDPEDDITYDVQNYWYEVSGGGNPLNNTEAKLFPRNHSLYKRNIADPPGGASAQLVKSYTSGGITDNWPALPNGWLYYLRTSVRDPDTGVVIGAEYIDLYGIDYQGNRRYGAAIFIRQAKKTYIGDANRLAEGNGDQYLYYLLAIGQGHYRIDNLFLGDMDITDLDSEDLRWESFPPGTYSRFGDIAAVFNQSLDYTEEFHEDVITSIEAGSQELDEPKATSYFPLAGGGYTDRVVVDLAFDRGLYKTHPTTGTFQPTVVDFMVHIKGQGLRPVSHMIRVASSLRDVSPFRRSIIFDIPKTRKVSVRIERITEKAETAGRANDAARLAGLKARRVREIADYPDIYSDTHLVAIRLRANELVSASAEQQIRVRSSRLIDQFNIPGRVGTSNPINIAYDIYTNQVYGGRRPDTEIDAVLFDKLRQKYDGSNGFNGVIAERTTIYEAMRSVLAPVAAEPLAIGSQISVNYDGVRTITQQLFNETNIVEGTLQATFEFDRVGEHDGVKVEYRDTNTWQPAFVTVPNVGVTTAYDPLEVVLFGCTSKNIAQQYAQLLVNRKQLRRKLLTFDTELEGLIVHAGDRIAVTEEVVNWGQSGFVHGYDTASRVMDLDQSADLKGAGPFYIVLRDKDGRPTPRIAVTLDVDNKVILASAPPIAITPAQTSFSLGDASSVTNDFTVLKAAHRGDMIVNIEAVNYDPLVYQNTMSFLQ